VEQGRAVIFNVAVSSTGWLYGIEERKLTDAFGEVDGKLAAGGYFAREFQ
jgi:hypothetical protein